MMNTPSNQKKTSISKQVSPSFVKLAMKNMVRKGKQSLIHFGLTAVGLGGFILLIAWLGRPNLPH